MVQAVAAAGVLAFAACSGGVAGLWPPANVPAPVSNRTSVAAFGQISIYAPGKTAPSKVVTDGVDGPDAMVMDASGNLYVANIQKATVTVYAPGATSPSRTIRSGIGLPLCLAVDSRGDLFVASAIGGLGLRGKVTEYAPGGSTVIRRIDATVDVIGWHGGQRGLAVDEAGNLYAGISSTKRTFARVDVYRPDATVPARTITDGVASPQDLALDRSGNLYVLNGYASTYVFAPKTNRPFRTIASGNDIAFDSRGRAYVNGPAGIVEYAPNRKTIIRTITAGLDSPNAIAVDRYDNLYAGNASLFFRPGSVTVYSHRDGSLLRTIREGVEQPSELLFDKGGNLYVASYPHYD